MRFVSFMARPSGRLARVFLGAILVFAGLGLIGGISGEIVAGLGLLPVAMGIFNVCMIAPLFGGPISGRATRKPTHERPAAACCSGD
jgi:hypothetical protein